MTNYKYIRDDPSGTHSVILHHISCCEVFLGMDFCLLEMARTAGKGTLTHSHLADLGCYALNCVESLAIKGLMSCQVS